MQEGQAGRSGQSGLATGTENRREMNRVKRKKESSYSNGEGQRERGWVWGRRETPRGHPLYAWAGEQGAKELGFEAARAAEREEGVTGKMNGTQHLAEVQKRILPRPWPESGEQWAGEKEVPERAKPGQ